MNELLCTLFQLLRVVEIDKSKEMSRCLTLYIYIYVRGRPPPLLIVQKIYNSSIDLLNWNSLFFLFFSYFIIEIKLYESSE